MTTEIKALQTEIHDDVDWLAEALPTDTTEMADRVEQAQRPIEDDSEYATLYFVA